MDDEFLESENSTSELFFSPLISENGSIVAKRPLHNSLFETPIRFVGYFEFFVFFFGTPANILVLYLTLNFLRQNFRRTSSNYHQSNLWFVVSMTTADLFFCALHSPMMFFQYVLGVRLNGLLCFFLYIITHTTTICSSLSLLWLNVDKFFYLNRPLDYHRRVTTGRALGLVLITWAISLCWAIFFMLGPFSKYTPPCDFRPSEIHFYIAFAVLFFVLPTLISLSISVYIASVVVRVSKENAIRKNSRKCSASVATVTSVQRTTNAKAIVFVFTTTLWSSITYLPYRFAYLFYISPEFRSVTSSWSATAAFYFLFALMTANAAGNPFITIITQRRYTMAAEQVWRWVKAATRGGKPIRRKTSSNASSTMMTFHSMASKMSIKWDHRVAGNNPKLIEDPDAESAL